jgi:hypothetical protein
MRATQGRPAEIITASDNYNQRQISNENLQAGSKAMSDLSRSAYDVTAGIRDGALTGISPREKALIVKLLSRVAERSFRRGLQQGVQLKANKPHLQPGQLADWRYGRSTDKAPWFDCKRIETSTNRLFMENWELHRIGLHEP